MKTQQPERSLHRRSTQKGITLVVALIMLTVLTTIAITVANMTTVDLKIVSNRQAAQQARAAAESGIDFLVSNPAQLQLLAPFSPAYNGPMEKLPNDGPSGAPLTVTGSGWTATVSVQRMGDPLPCPKATLPTSASNIDSNTIANCVYFEINSTGQSSRNATATLTRGFYRKVGGHVAG